MNVFTNVMLNELKMGVAKKVLDVFEVARDEVVHANDPKAILDEAVT
jgi:hypothetical protein